MKNGRPSPLLPQKLVHAAAVVLLLLAQDAAFAESPGDAAQPAPLADTLRAIVPPAHADPKAMTIAMKDGMGGEGDQINADMQALRRNIAGLAAWNTPRTNADLDSFGKNYSYIPALGTDLGKTIALIDNAQITERLDEIGTQVAVLMHSYGDAMAALGLSLQALNSTAGRAISETLVTIWQLHNGVEALNANVASLSDTYSNLMNLSVKGPSHILAIPGLGHSLGNLDKLARGDIKDHLSGLAHYCIAAQAAFRELESLGGVSHIATRVDDPDHPDPKKPGKVDDKVLAALIKVNRALQGVGIMARRAGWGMEGTLAASPPSINSGDSIAPRSELSPSYEPTPDYLSARQGRGSLMSQSTVTPPPLGEVGWGWLQDGTERAANPTLILPQGRRKSQELADNSAQNVIVAGITPASYSAMVADAAGPAGDGGLAAASRPFSGIPLIAKPDIAPGSVQVAFAKTGMTWNPSWSGGSCIPGAGGPISSCPNLSIGGGSPISSPALPWINSPQAALGITTGVPLLPCFPQGPVQGTWSQPSGPPITVQFYGYTNTGFSGVSASASQQWPVSAYCKDDRYKNITIKGPMAPVQLTGVLVADTGSLLTQVFTVFQGYADLNGPYNGTQGAMANANDKGYGMAHKDTPAIPLVVNYPWLFKDTDADQNAVYRGTGNNTEAYIDSSETLALSPNGGPTVGLSTTDDTDTVTNNDPEWVNTQKIQTVTQCGTPTNTCGTGGTSTTTPAGSSGGGNDYANYQYWVRFARDSCTNQYILPLAMNPSFVFSNNWRADQYPWSESYCQPLVLTPVNCMPYLYGYPALPTSTCLLDTGENDKNQYDYRAWGYLEWAYFSVLNHAYSPGLGNSNQLIVQTSLLGAASSTAIGAAQAPAINPADDWGEINLPPSFTVWSLVGFGGSLGTVNATGIVASAGLGQPGYIVPPQNGGSQYQAFGQITVPATVFSSTFGLVGFDWDNPGSALANFMPWKGALTKSNDLIQRPYERIWDPTHPFTPRWDMVTNIVPLVGPLSTDRAYSILTVSQESIPGVGYTNSNNSTVPLGGCNVRCAVQPVDVLQFRALEFNACMMCRIMANTWCFWSDVAFDTNAVCVLPPLSGSCYIPVIGEAPLTGAEHVAYNAVMNIDELPAAVPPIGAAPGAPCKYNLVNITTPGLPKWPPCSTEFDDALDAGVGLKPPSVPTCQFEALQELDDCYKDANDYSDITAGQIHPGSVTKCCNDLAQAVAPLNTLKIRNLVQNPQLLDSSGHYAEGYAFKDYFGNHFPFMRWWDTGYAVTGIGSTSAAVAGISGLVSDVGAGPTKPVNPWPTNYDPTCEMGQYDVIVGVGAEGDAGNIVNGAIASTGFPGSSTGAGTAGICRWGGGGGNGYKCIGTGSVLASTLSAATGGAFNGGSVPGSAHPQISNPDRLTSWYELKQYQTNSIRNLGMNCLPMHEKVWKWMDAEDGALYQAGRHYSGLVQMKSDKSSSHASLFEYKNNRWPLRWRGYIDAFGQNQFPQWDPPPNVFGSVVPALNNPSLSGYAPSSVGSLIGGQASIGPAGPGQYIGLDNAVVGDIVYILPCDGAAQMSPGSQVSATGNVANAVGSPSLSTLSTLFSSLGGGCAGGISSGLSALGSLAGAAVQGSGGGIPPFIGVVTAAQHNTSNTSSICPGGLLGAAAGAGAKAAGGSIECTDLNATCSDFVEILDVNNGKYPDACGMTDYAGIGQTRTIFKEWLPPSFQNYIFSTANGPVTNTDSCGDSHTVTNGPQNGNLSAAGYCSDPKYFMCTLKPPGGYFSSVPIPSGGITPQNANYWNQVHVYRPSQDERGTSSLIPSVPSAPSIR